MIAREIAETVHALQRDVLPAQEALQRVPVPLSGFDRDVQPLHAFLAQGGERLLHGDTGGPDAVGSVFIECRDF